MSKTTPRRGTPKAAVSSVAEFVKNLSAEGLRELRALLTPAGDAPAKQPQPEPKAARVPGKFPMKVRVIEGLTGYYNHIRRRSGDVFVITHPKEFSERWMEPVDPATPEQITTGKEELRKKHDEILQSRRPASGTPLVHDEPLADSKNPLNA